MTTHHYLDYPLGRALVVRTVTSGTATAGERSRWNCPCGTTTRPQTTLEPAQRDRLMGFLEEYRQEQRRWRSDERNDGAAEEVAQREA